MQEVTNGPALDPLREARRVGAGRPHADQRAAAQRLRERGFSYRRIAEVLRIRYDTVSRWLYGDAPAAAPPVAAPLPPVARSAPPVAA
ncbi:hypothetical protein E2C05_27480, partial [Paracraurococcus ruber]|uniref:helix-turn-helix domain-containing protein n=1 Tax=Paracraurococcus ruber TaxID=77675 RepID=UPI001F01D063